MLAAAFGQAQTRESLELQQPNTTPSDQSQPDSNETFKAVSDELHEKVSDTKILTTTTETSTTPDAPDTSNEKVELPELGAIISSVIPLSNVKVNGTTRHSDGDISLEMSSLERQISQVIVTVNETIRIDPAAQAVNKTTSSDEVDTVTNVPSRNTIGSRLLRNRLTRLQTTTVRNVVPISKDSNEEGDSKKKTMKSDDGQIQSNTPKPVRIRTTTTRNPIARDSDEVVDSITTTTTRAPVSRNRFNRIQTTTTSATTVRSDSVEKVDDSSSKTTTVRSLPSGNRFGRLRTTTVSTPTTTDDSKEQIDAGKTTQTTTARNSLSGSRFSRVRTTTVRATTSSDSSAEREDLVTPVSTTQPTTVRGSNRFNRFRATTTTAATTISKDSGEQDESVTPTPSTTTTRSLSRNRFSNFRGTTTSSPVSRDSDEQIDKVKVIQRTPTTTTSRIFVPGNRLSRLRVTTIRSSSTATANSDEDIDTGTATPTTTARNLRTGNRFSGRSRSTTTVPTTTTISSDSDERDDSVNGTTTTARSVSRGNRFNNRFRATTAIAPTTTTISKSSDEQEDSTVVIPSTTIRNSLLRNRFIRTTTVRVPTTTVEDSIEQEDVINGTQKINSTSAERISRIRVTTVSAIKSSDSGEQDEIVNGTLTSTVRNLESEEKMDLVNSTQQVTTSRSSIFLKYFNRYRTTKASHSNSDNSDEDEINRANETSAQVDNSTSRQNLLNRLRSAAASLPAASNLTAPVTPAPLETTNNLGRKDRAIIYNSAKSDNQLMTSTISTVHVETTRSTPPMTASLSPPPPGFYTFGSSDEINDTSEDDDEDASRTPYFDPFYGVPIRESSAGVPSKEKENSLEVEDVSSELELNSSVTVKPDESSEITMADMISSKVTDVQHVYLHPDVQDDVSVEVVITVPNHPHHDVQNQTLMAQQHAFHLATTESDEGNDGSVEEKEGSGDAVEEDQNVKNSTTPVQEKSADPVKESDEGNSKEKEGSGDVPEDANLGGNNETNTTRVDEVSVNNSDENEENSSLEIDLSKLTDIQRALTDVKPDEVVIPDVVPELQRFFTDVNKPVELFLEDRNHQTAAIASVPTIVMRRNRNESVIRPTPSNDEVTMKLKELLTNPVVQQRLEAIDGRLKSTKSARVKRLIEKYLAALAKLSTNSASTVSTSSFSVFLPLLITCFLFGFS